MWTGAQKTYGKSRIPEFRNSLPSKLNKIIMAVIDTLHISLSINTNI